MYSDRSGAVPIDPAEAIANHVTELAKQTTWFGITPAYGSISSVFSPVNGPQTVSIPPKIAVLFCASRLSVRNANDVAENADFVVDSIIRFHYSPVNNNVRGC